MIQLPGVGETRRNVVVNLAPGVLITESRLEDVDGQVYELDPAGATLCRIFAEPADVGTTVAGIAELSQAPPHAVEEPVWEFVEDLSSRGLLSVNCAFSAERAAQLAELPGRMHSTLSTGVIAPTEVRRSLRRYPGTLRGLVRAGLEAHQATAWIGVALVIAAAGFAFSLSPTETGRSVGVRGALLLMSGYFTLLLTNIFIHEFAHLVTARLSNCTLYGVYCRLSGMGISFSTTSEPSRLAIAASGPLAALAVDLIALATIVAGPGTIWSAAGIDQLRLSAVAGVTALAFFQLLCLTPLTQDGRRIAAALKAMAGKARTHA